MTTQQINVRQKTGQILDEWIGSCVRGGSISRNTVAIGIVALDHLRRRCPQIKEDVVSPGGEIKGARSGLGGILESYGIPPTYLKEATTRQAHQDGQRLLDALAWGYDLAQLPDQERDDLLLELIGTLVAKAQDWLARQNLRLDIDRRQSPIAWVQLIVESAKSHSGGVVEQHLVGAKLERRFKNMAVPNLPVHAADRQTAREGDFTISKTVYHVTANPGGEVIQKCATNIRAGKSPILLVPNEQVYRARVLAQEHGIEKEVAVLSIEDFVALNIIELAAQDDKDLFAILREIVQIYNQRLAQVETDLSLRIEVR